jgi:hypothetical protein
MRGCPEIARRSFLQDERLQAEYGNRVVLVIADADRRNARTLLSANSWNRPGLRQ